MRLLLISGAYPPTRAGEAEHTRLIAERLAARGVEVRVITSECGDASNRDGTPVYARMRQWSWRELPRLLWLIWRLGYDRRALLAMTLLCWVVLPLTFVLVHENQPGRAGNVNKILGWSDAATEPPIAPLLWLGVLMLGNPLLVYLPTHFLLRWLAPAPRTASRSSLVAFHKMD